MSANNKANLLILSFVFLGAIGIVLFKEKITVTPPKITTKNLIPNIKKEPEFKEYMGVLPCLDCRGVQTVLRLENIDEGSSSAKYILSEEYIGKEETVVSEGNYVLTFEIVGEDEIYKIVLDHLDSKKRKYFLKNSDGSIKLLDKLGKDTFSEINYTLMTDSAE